MNEKEKRIAAIKEALDYFDPEGLLRLGAPEDEYILEATFIEKEMALSVDFKLKGIISRAFKKYFDSNLSDEINEKISQRISSNLAKTRC